MVYVLMDSNAYVDGSILYEYDSIHADQVEWYTAQIKSLADVYTGGDTSSLPSIAMWHIACKEYQMAYDEHVNGGGEWLDIGENEELEEYVSEPAYPDTDTIFEAIRGLGSTKMILVGHDHYNSFGAKYKGVYLCYGLAADFISYAAWDPDFESKTEFRGGTLLLTGDDSSVRLIQDRYVGEDTSLSLDGLWA